MSAEVIGACIEVHRHLGPGLLESAYQSCLAHELSIRGIRFARQTHVPLIYKELQLDCGYRLDLIVESALIVEVKSVERLQPIHCSQMITYLKLAAVTSGLLVNFNVGLLTNGVRRLELKGM